MATAETVADAERAGGPDAPPGAADRAGLRREARERPRADLIAELLRRQPLLAAVNLAVGSLAAGAELHLVPPEANLLPHQLSSFIRQSRLTQWFSVPSTMAYLAKFDAVPATGFETVERVIWCGEVLPTPDDWALA